MERVIQVRWTCSEQIKVDIPDGKFTRKEIKKIVDKAAQRILPGGGDYCDDWDFEWDSEEPKAIEVGNIPPDDYWFECAGYTVASNGYALLVKGCPVGFCNDSEWRKIEEKNIPAFAKILSADFANLPPHRGWFRKAFECFKGCRVVGNTPKTVSEKDCGGYVLDASGTLIAVLMPLMPTYTRGDYYDESSCFQFNSEVK